MSVTIISDTSTTIIDNKSTSILNGTASATSTSTSISSSETQITSPSNNSSPSNNNNNNNNNAKPTTMPVSRKMRLQQMLWHSLMEAKGEIVGVTKTNGETYSGVLFAIEPNDSLNKQNGIINNNNNNNNAAENNNNNSDLAWKYIILKYVQKMSDPNMDPSQRMKAPFMEELKIPASDFAVLSAKGLTDHTNSYRRNDRQAFNDATGRKLHRKERELVRWDAGSNSIDATELENDDDLDELRNGSYDQFKANEKYNISATFDESIYTSNLDKSGSDYTKNFKEAKEDEQRIMEQPVTNKHVADDRSYFINRNQNNKNKYNQNDMEHDAEDTYSRVLHEASMSKQTINNTKLKIKKNNQNSYQPPHLRNNHNNNQNNKKNKGHNKQNNHQRDNNNNNNNNRRPPMNRDNHKNKQNQQNQHNNNNNNMNNTNSPNRIDNNNSNINNNNNLINSPNLQQNNQNQNQNQNNINNLQNQNNINNLQNQAINSSNNNPNPNPKQTNQQSAAILQALANQNQILQQAKLAQFAHTNNSLSGGLFAGLPPHIAQIVQTVTPQNALQNMNPIATQMTTQQLQLYKQQLLQQQQQHTQQINSPNNKDASNNINNINEEGINNQDITGLKDDAASLNPHAKAFTPQIAPNQNQKQQQNNQTQNNQNQNQVQQQQQQNTNTNTTTPSGSAQQLLTQQQQALLTQQLPLGQYNYNPATGQYVLNPFAAQGQQQQLALLQQQQYQAHLQQIAIQQQLLQQQHNQPQIGQNIAQQQSDPTSQLLAQHQQQLLAHQQAQQQQAQLLAQQAQANGLNIGAPLFTPSNMPNMHAQQAQVTGVNINTQQLNQPNILTQQTNQFQQNANVQQQAALLAQAQAQQQQFLPFGVIPQQQFYMGNANMQNLMQQ